MGQRRLIFCYLFKEDLVWFGNAQRLIGNEHIRLRPKAAAWRPLEHILPPLMWVTRRRAGANRGEPNLLGGFCWTLWPLAAGPAQPLLSLSCCCCYCASRIGYTECTAVSLTRGWWARCQWPVGFYGRQHLLWILPAPTCN